MKTTEVGMTASPRSQHTNEITAGVTMTVTVSSMSLDKDENNSDASRKTTVGNAINPVLMLHLKIPN